MSSPINPEGLVGNPNAVPEELNISRQVEPGGGPTVYPGGRPRPAVDNENANTPAGNFSVNSSSVATNSDYVGSTNVTDMTGDIARDTSAYIDQQGANLSDQVPDIDANAPGSNLDGTDYGMDADALNQSFATGAVDTAADVTKPNDASGYDAATTADQVANNLADAATMETNENAIVDPDGIVIDQQGVATGINEDGSINETGLALNTFAHQNISKVIDTSTVSGKLLAQTLGEGNYLDSKSTVKGQLDILTAEFTDPVTGEPKIPTWGAGIARNVSRSIAFKGVTGTAAMGALASAMIEATLPIAQADSQFYQTLTVKNLDNKQQMIINKANVLSKMELANLDVRTSLAVNNAKTFMAYDMANLANEQQTEIINSQSMVQSILEDANQTNVARRFNSEQQNDMDKFYDNLGASIDMYNTGQVNQMSMFNTGEENNMNQFNANMENSREQFYLDMQYQVDSANAAWRQTVTLTETEMEFNAAATDVKNILNLSSEVMNQLWDRTDSLLDYSWREGENALDRETNLELAKMQLEAARLQAKATAKAGKYGALGSMVGTAVGAYAALSDSRMKKNVVEKAELSNGVKLYSWDWTDEAIEKGWGNTPTTGVVAQQVQKIKPENVYMDKAGDLRVDYRGIEQ